ncbi:hypothetical protein [Bacillus sp. CGMCC 1.16541]|uniref:hypothetical protein n=1 Tax=Bacillus sp. CGMCC 1.16541 TaxID=2185143 RepID=UPI000D72BE4D|nr:hypothetical protein [Bacillus sp. CGMCC 1.16541]
MSNQNFHLDTRTQFSFMTTDHRLSCALSEIVEQAININGYMQVEISVNQNLVRIVPGTTTSELEDEIRKVRLTLNSLGIKFREKKVIQMTTIPGVPGQLNTIYSALWCRVNVKAIYPGEDNILYMDVVNMDKALHILSSDELLQCPRDCKGTPPWLSVDYYAD